MTHFHRPSLLQLDILLSIDQIGMVAEVIFILYSRGYPLRTNNISLIKKTFSKAIIDRTRFINNKLANNKQIFAKHRYEKLKRNVIATLIKEQLQIINWSGTRLSLFFSYKGVRSQRINLIEQNKTIGSDVEISLILTLFIMGVGGGGR